MVLNQRANGGMRRGAAAVNAVAPDRGTVDALCSVWGPVAVYTVIARLYLGLVMASQLHIHFFKSVSGRSKRLHKKWGRKEAIKSNMPTGNVGAMQRSIYFAAK